MAIVFQDRREAGRLLAGRLAQYAGRDDVIVLALPRGGVPVAFEVARALKAPLDVCVVRKLGVPGDQELAMGAIAAGGVRILNSEIVDGLALPAQVIESVIATEEKELARREHLYRGGRPLPRIKERTVILVDDGLATGSTMRAAIQALRNSSPARIVAAVPVGNSDTCEAMTAIADEVVCAAMPQPLLAIGHWYEDFSQTSDDEVRGLLDSAVRSIPSAPQNESSGNPVFGDLRRDILRLISHSND